MADNNSATPTKIISLDNLSTYNGLIEDNYLKAIVISYEDYLKIPEQTRTTDGKLYYVYDAPGSAPVLGDYIFVLSGTLTAGSTSLTFTDARLTANTILDFFYSTDGVTYNSFTQNSATSFTLTFTAQASDLTVKVICYNL